MPVEGHVTSDMVAKLAAMESGYIKAAREICDTLHISAADLGRVAGIPGEIMEKWVTGHPVPIPQREGLRLVNLIDEMWQAHSQDKHDIRVRQIADEQYLDELKQGR